MGSHIQNDTAAILGFGQHALFVVCHTGLNANGFQTLLFEQALRQCRAQSGANGVGTLYAQHAAVIARNGQGRKD